MTINFQHFIDTLPFNAKQLQYIREANAKHNLCHGSVRAGKTVAVVFKFLLDCTICPGNMIWMLGNTLDDVFQNCIAIILHADKGHPLSVFTPFVTWHKSGILEFFGKEINVLGARDERALGKLQGKTMDLCYCNEMTLYPESVLNMLPSRLSMPHSKLHADMNPSHPEHKCKKMIDLAKSGDPSYYELDFKIEDNIKYLGADFIKDQQKLMTGLFYRRYYLGEWCLAEGAIFDFFERDIHVDKQLKPADFWIAGIDYGASNAFACVVLGVKNKKYENDQAYAQVQAEYYYSAKGTRAKTNSEYVEDLEKLFLKYPVRAVYLDPSAASFKAELQRKNINVRDTDNEVLAGITLMTDLVARGEVSVHQSCTNLIREIQGYSWDDKAAKRGEDKPIKVNDHCFLAGTKVHTDLGRMEIQDLKPGVLVKTRSGYQKIVRTGCTIKDCFNYKFYDRSINCSSDHKFYTQKGWKSISELIQSDILYTTEHAGCLNLSNLNSKNLTGNDIDDIQILQNVMKGIIFRQMVDISIEKYTNITKEKYHEDIIYITSTKTPLTMIYPICNVYLQENTSSYMNTILSLIISLIKSVKQRSDGISPKWEENGIQNMLLNTDSGNGNRKLLNASNVQYLIPLPSDQETNFVQINVNLNTEESLVLIMSKDNALFAKKNFLDPSILRKKAAQGLVVENYIGKQKLYNLEVEKDNEFFAENILVHNSVDALRYALKGFLGNRTSFGSDNKFFKDDFGRSLGYNPNRGW